MITDITTSLLRPLHSLNPYQRGLLVLSLGTFLFSAKGISIKYAYQYGVNPTTLMAIRMTIALPFYLWVLRRNAVKGNLNNIRVGQILCCCGLGFVGYYVAAWLDLTGLLYLPASLERLVLYTYPSMVVILAMLFLGQQITLRLLICLLLIYLGLGTTFAENAFEILYSDVDNSDDKYLFGALLVFASAFACALFFVGSEVMMRKLSSQTFTSIAMLAAAVGIFAHYSLKNSFDLAFQQPSTVYFYGAIIAIFCTVIPTFLTASGIQLVGAARGSVIGGTGPIITLILAFIFLGESISALQTVGFALILVGVTSMRR